MRLTSHNIDGFVHVPTLWCLKDMYYPNNTYVADFYDK
jgi:hypothetical protein